jgi:hypothetical protein
MVFMYPANDPDALPLVGFGFKDIEAGRAIFKGWKNKLGERDKDEQIRISIITGVDVKKPASYKVMVRSNPKVDPKDSSERFLTLVSRFNRMDPPTSKNLDMFLQTYDRVGAYGIVPVHYISETDVSASLNLDLLILKSELFLTPAWQINENSPEIAAISEEDEIIIPDGVDSAEVLKRVKKFSASK